MSLAPALLLSMPQLIDPNFAKSVVLLCEHAPEGAFGLVVNRPSDIAAAEAVRLEPPVDDPNDLPLLIGGPVEPERGWILTAQAPEHVEHRSVGAGLYLSASPVLLRRALTMRPTPRRTQVLAGYAGWGPGQQDDALRSTKAVYSDVRSSEADDQPVLERPLTVFVDGPTGFTFIYLLDEGWKFVGQVANANR